MVLVDTGLYEPGGMRQLELALDQAGLRVEHIRLLVCTHAHSDHYGLAGPIIERAGCELWMHPNHRHMTRAAADPDRAFERRLEVARQSGVPADALARYEKERRGQGYGIAEIVMPDRDLVPGVEVDTDLGRFQVYETPGHAPSHVVLHQPDRGLLLSGDHLLGRVSLFFDYGWSPDPAGEFLRSLDTVDGLDVQLMLAGHGRPVREARALIRANRTEVHRQLDVVRAAIAERPKAPFEIVPDLVGGQASGPDGGVVGAGPGAELPGPPGGPGRGGALDEGDQTWWSAGGAEASGGLGRSGGYPSSTSIRCKSRRTPERVAVYASIRCITAHALTRPVTKELPG